jgi:GNAT superfamily N-acetyltransferase
MIVKETPWDDRNLGLATREISVAESDADADVLSALEFVSALNDSYSVIKIPPKKTSLIHSLEKQGFRFLEAQADIHKNLKDGFLPPYLSKIADAGSSVRIETPEDCEKLLSRINGVFDSDRICLDPFFGEKISALRYKNWIRDCFGKKEYHLALVRAAGTDVGFFFLKENDEAAADSALAGLFPEFKQQGYGPLIISTHLNYARSLGKKKLVTRVSLNNTESLRMHLAFGYEIAQSHYVMRYLSKDS